MITTPVERKLLNKEKQITKKLLELSIHTYFKKPRDLYWDLKYESIEKEIDKLIQEWFAIKKKCLSYGYKIQIKIDKIRRKNLNVEYFIWNEAFVDEDTGEVVDVERTQILTIDGVLLDRHGKTIKFNPTEILKKHAR